ncbi:hypothetical protein HMPREF1487_09150 [Pseudomonas sp. HPB0071]|uniref:Uncharacterized protein n=1 Tax=Pseudomonas luteola TaxID=47886 RepID=A0A2X2BX73_PSELU|nr:hypothetical protein HMPREF1487_09150 [Pseudomonas sp. HPB0071]SHJ42301.1 hypothetical protein SAMN05216295_11376 [Pseudomonas zeshuii]SPZ00140.1 Uncharacterised protein [Pseudomonas luteola]SPZ00347.1 Uncharacterised protein [Pseudomonas luteola]
MLRVGMHTSSKVPHLGQQLFIVIVVSLETGFGKKSRRRLGTHVTLQQLTQE